MENNKQKRTSMGRQKIEIKKIEKTSQLQVTFSKRRTGIFKKAGELSVLCGANVAVIVTSPAGKVFSFGSPSVDSVVDRFLAGNPNPNPNSECSSNLNTGVDGLGRVQQLRKKYVKVESKLKAEKEREKAVEGLRRGGGFWWDEGIEDLGLHELEQYVAALEVLKKNIMARADEMAAATAVTASSLASGGGVVADAFGSSVHGRSCFGFDCKPF